MWIRVFQSGIASNASAKLLQLISRLDMGGLPLQPRAIRSAGTGAK
jgi:hypothetical protein